MKVQGYDGDISGGRGACAGDSGGPLIAKSEANNGAATLVGAVSFGTAVCASLRRPAVYTNIGYYRDWLDAQMPDLATCQPPEHSNWIINVVPESFTETSKFSQIYLTPASIDNENIILYYII